ncbi:MAG: hypothetical protein V3W43_05365, partial [Desulfatiglandaceae bacterium]
ILYDNVEKAGVELDNVILTSIGDYLPTFKKMFGKSALAKAYSGMEVPSPEHIKEAGLHQFRDLIDKYPPSHRMLRSTQKRTSLLCLIPGGPRDCQKQPF